MTGLGLRLALREPVRFALTAVGLACAVILTVFLGGVYRGAVRGSLSYIEEADADLWVGRRGSWNLMRASGLLSGKVRDRIALVHGVQSVEPILAALLPAEANRVRRTLLVVGIDADAELTRPHHLLDGRAVPSSGEVVVDRAFARRAGVDVGDTISLAGHNAAIVGITEHTNLLVTQYAFVARADLARAVGLRNVATFFLARVTRGSSAAVAAAIEQGMETVAVYDRATFLANNRQEIEAGFLPVLWTVALMGLAVGAAVVALMTYAAVLDKRKDYVLLAAIGAGARTRFGVVLEQAVLAAAVGGVTGVGFLRLLQTVLPTVVPEIHFRLEPWVVIAALAGAMAMAVIGAVVPGRVATRVAPLEALRP